MRQWLILFLAQTTWLAGEIIEADHFSEILPYANEETLLVLDIDDTLLIPKQMLGCDEWYQLRLKHYLVLEGTFEKALDRALAEWEGIRHYTQMEIVEEGTETLIDQLQQEGIQVMGLTTQGLALATRTSMQLAEVGIDLTKTAPASQDAFFVQNDHGILFRKGILFTSGQAKGKALFNLLASCGKLPKRVVFINDKMTHLADVEATSQEWGIEFIGLRYAFSDVKKAAFSPEIAQFQFEHSTFSHILTDKEAKEEIFLQNGL